MTEEWRKTNADAVGEALASAAGVAAGGALGGPVGAVAGGALSPFAARAVLAITDAYFPRRNESPARMIQRAADHLGISASELAVVATESEDRLQLSGEAIWAAWHTLNEQKIDALAKALANGLTDDTARVDESRLVIAALADMEATHIRLLAHLGTPGKSPHVPNVFTVKRIATECTWLRPVAVGPVVATLARHHCIAVGTDTRKLLAAFNRSMAFGSGATDGPSDNITITDFGRASLDYLQEPPQSGGTTT